MKQQRGQEQSICIRTIWQTVPSFLCVLGNSETYLGRNPASCPTSESAISWNAGLKITKQTQ